MNLSQNGNFSVNLSIPLGMVAYQCISGLGDSELPDAVTRSRTQRKGQIDLTPAIEAGKGLYSPKLLEAIGRAMQVDEGDRPQGVAAWCQALTEGSRRKSPLRSVRKPATRPTGGITTERTGMRWSGVVLTLVVVALLGACTGSGRQAGQEALERELAGEMVSISGGTFRMGDMSGEGDDERPVHSVTVPAFKMGKYEVTFAQWDACVTDGGCGRYQPSDWGWGRGNRPVTDVTWDHIQLFIDWLNAKTGGNFRLPTEAEWAYAARTGRTTAYSWGNSIGSNRANCDGCGSRWDGDRTAPVGSFPANAWGLHDMHGNVWEWVQDCWHDSYVGAPADGRAWVSGGDCGLRVIRGGSWYSGPRNLRSAHRDWGARTVRGSLQGFRLAQDL